MSIAANATCYISKEKRKKKERKKKKEAFFAMVEKACMCVERDERQAPASSYLSDRVECCYKTRKRRLYQGVQDTADMR